MRKHLENVYPKLGVNTRTAAVASFLGLIEAEASSDVATLIGKDAARVLEIVAKAEVSPASSPSPASCSLSSKPPSTPTGRLHGDRLDPLPGLLQVDPPKSVYVRGRPRRATTFRRSPTCIRSDARRGLVAPRCAEALGFHLQVRGN